MHGETAVEGDFYQVKAIAIKGDQMKTKQPALNYAVCTVTTTDKEQYDRFRKVYEKGKMSHADIYALGIKKLEEELA